MTRWARWQIVVGVLLVGCALARFTVRAAEPEQVATPSPAESSGPIVHIVRPGERLEMLVNTSRILTLQHRIPQAMVNNPDLLSVTALSPTQFQISAKKPGVTQVNLWDEKQQIYTVDVVISGDGRELTTLLDSEFPSAAIKVRPISGGVLISGFAERAEDVDRIKQIAEEYYPKVILNVTVAGVQQVLLHIKVYEVSRTKLRNLGFDFAQLTEAGGFVASSAANILAGPTSTLINGASGLGVAGASTFAFKAVSHGSTFFGILDALEESDLAKICSEPTLVTQSGRPAFFNVGGDIYGPQSQGLGAVTFGLIASYGTRLDFVPFVLGNGRIHLDVRPEVSEVDASAGASIPGIDGAIVIKNRRADTGVELESGETLAIAGLVQTRIEAQKLGLPWVSDVPYIGALFRRVREENNEVETLILVTPEIVDALAPHQVPPCLPGTTSRSPTDWELYMRGMIERPNYCPNGPAGPGPVPASEAVPGRPSAPGEPVPAPPQPEPPTNRQSRSNAVPPSGTAGDVSKSGSLPGFLGPMGYDKGE